MAAYNDRVPLKDGTVLHTTDGKRFHILHSTSIGGSAILYSAHLDGSSLDVTLKEFYPAGCVRVNGVALDPGLAAPDASPALRQAFYQRLERMAQHELELSQLAYNGSFHALPHLEQLEVCSISQPEEPVHRSADGTALPCTFLYLPTLNPSKGFFLSDLLAECAAYPRDKEHPFGALMSNEPRSIAAPHILTTLHLIRLILDALATLHKTAIHGDISLGNLFIDGDLHTGTLRGAVFLDFGSARLLDAPNGKTAPILPSEKLYTTPLFCAPEIFTGARSGEPFCLTPAADVYSVGVLLRLLLRKEALAAYRKFPEDLAEELKPAEIYPSDTVPSARPVLPQLNTILSAAAEPDPEKRIPVAEMLKEINALIEQLSAPRFPLAENLSSSESFIPHSRDNELKAIRKQMDSGVRPIFLYGLGGLGKTETARALLRQCKKDGMRVAFFNYEQSVRNTILNLEFTNYRYTPSTPHLSLQQQEEEHYYENLKLLAAMGSDSVVVMDNFDSNSQTLDDLRREPAYQDLINLGGPHLIITTRFTPKGNPPVEIKPLPKELLLKMMLNIMDEKDNSPSVDTLLNIIEAVQGHTLTCYLIGNALSDPLGDLTAQDVLDALKQYDLHSLTEDVTSDKDRKYSTGTIYGHLKILFNMCGMTDTYRAALCHTLLLPQKGLDVKLFRQGESKEEQSALRSLIAHGWVQCTCSTENIHLLTIHPLIRELILNELKPQEEDENQFFNRIETYCDDFLNQPYSDDIGDNRTLEKQKCNYADSTAECYEAGAEIPVILLNTRIQWIEKAIAYYDIASKYSEPIVMMRNSYHCYKKKFLLMEQIPELSTLEKIPIEMNLKAYIDDNKVEEHWKKSQLLYALFHSLSENDKEDSIYKRCYCSYCEMFAKDALKMCDLYPDSPEVAEWERLAQEETLNGSEFHEKLLREKDLSSIDDDERFWYITYYKERADYYSETDSELADFYIQKSSVLINLERTKVSQKEQQKKHTSCSYYKKLGDDAFQFDFEKALEYYENAISIAEKFLYTGNIWLTKDTAPSVICPCYEHCAEIMHLYNRFEKEKQYRQDAEKYKKKYERFRRNVIKVVAIFRIHDFINTGPRISRKQLRNRWNTVKSGLCWRQMLENQLKWMKKYSLPAEQLTGFSGNLTIDLLDKLTSNRKNKSE